jgi:hypothetical protein
MPRKKRRPLERPPFEPFKQEQNEAMYMLFAQGVFGELLQKDVPDWYKEDGRGMVVFIFKGETVSTLQPPIYIPAERWQTSPLFDDTGLNAAIADYNPAREFVLMVAGSKDLYAGYYAWWKVPLSTLPGTVLWER